MKAALVVENECIYLTKNDIPASNRSQIIRLLNQRLADCIDLQIQTKTAHWNVKGQNFVALHKLFDEINQSVGEYVDLIAERAVQLGGIARGTLRTVAEQSELDEYPLDIASGSDHVKALSAALAAFGARVRRSIDQADSLDDRGTADLFTEISRGIDKWLWFVEGHLQT
jgi:starvation-inducible DNA-binding protein